MLDQAIRNRNLKQVAELLSDNPSLIDGHDEDGTWLPFFAAKTGNLEILKYIVEYSRASFNEHDSENRSILHYGVESGRLSVVKYLTERVGMCPLHGDRFLVTPYELAHELGYSHIEAYLEEQVGAALSEMYKNPILTGMHPDPSVICAGEDFYMVNSSFIYFPCIPISHSRDLLHWEVIGHALDNPKWAANLNELEGGRGYWAPDISYHEGRYYITATFRLNDGCRVYRKQMVTSAERPEGPYEEPVYLDEDGIDPSIFTDDDGRRYMLLNRGARIFEISHDGKRQLSKAELLYYGHQKRAPEGAHLLKKDGWYYLFQAEGGTGRGHRISVSRSRELMGIYEPCPYNPIMRQTDEHAALQRCGHGKPVRTSRGEWYMVYLCGRQLDQKYSILGRETALDPITWTPDGWPLVNGLKGPSVLQKKPDLPEWIPESLEDKLEQGMLSREWVSPRTPEPDGIGFSDGWLILKGSREPLSSVKARNILLRRQYAFDFRFSVVMAAHSLKEGQEAGITCYYDENTYLTFGLVKNNGSCRLLIQEHIDECNQVTLCSGEDFVECQELHLLVITQGLLRSFYYMEGKSTGIPYDTKNPSGRILSCVGVGPWKAAGALEDVSYLCDEGLMKGKRFTGAMAGIYAYGGSHGPLQVRFRDMNMEC